MPDDELLQLARARIGRVLLGKYRIERVLGVGGMATVYLATHRNNKQFAVKMLHPEVSQREHLRTRFLREGYVANSVKHPGAVAVLDDDVAEDGSAFLVMELLEGAPVDEVWARHDKRMPLGLVLGIGDALLDVLAAAHARGIVHRDLKPPNLFLTRGGELKVLDFGIARLLDDTSGASATQTGTMMGTPAFMAPEQALAKASDVDAQTDLWAVGATLFSLLTGEFVHTGENARQLLVNAATQPARSLASVVSSTAPGVAAVIDKALAFDKKQRWAKASAMRDALQAACVEATGASIPALPRTATPTLALEETQLPAAPSTDESAFAPTVDSGGDDAPRAGRGITTSGAVAGNSAAAATAPVQQGRGRLLALGALASVVVAGGVASYRAAHAPRTTTCALAVENLDGARCGFELAPDVAGRRMTRTARITAVGGHVTSVEWVNFAGRQPADDLFREDFVRAPDGSVREVIRRDRHGNVLRWEKWTEGGKRVDLLDADGSTPRTLDGTSISTIRREFDARGWVVRATFFGPTGKPRANADGAYGYAYEIGASGRWTRRRVLGADGQPGAAASGLSLEARPDDGTPQGARLARFGVDDNPMTVNGVFEDRLVYGDGLDVIETQTFGLRGEPAVDLRLDAVVQRTRWDPARRVIESTMLAEGGAARPRKGESCIVLRTTLDERGRRKLEECLDANGNPMRARTGAATLRLLWSDQDDGVGEEALDANGAPTMNLADYARWTGVRDARGYLTEMHRFDEAGHPAPSKSDSPIQRWTYDDRGMQTSASSFDGQERPVADAYGVHEERQKFDRLRNQVESANFGVDGKPTFDDEAVSIYRDTYDDGDDHVDRSFFDETGAPVMYRGDVAVERFTNDAQGLLISAEALDTHGERALRKDGYAVVKYVRNRNGDVIEEAYLGKHDEPVSCSDGFARKTTKYDVHRRVVETALFGPTGAPATGSEGWSIEREQYDERGLVVREDHLDAGGHAVLTRDGSASVTRQWDAHGNLASETTLGVDGKPVACSGYVTRASSYDDRDELVQVELLGADGKPATGKDGWSMERLRHDDMGNLVEEAYFDVDHKPVVPSGTTYSSVRRRFDARQRLLEVSWLDTTGAPAKGPDDVAIVRYKRDDYGRPIETASFDGAGNPVASGDGTMVVRATYDAAGRLLEERYVDGAGAPRVASNGCTGHRMKYDAHGRKSEVACLDAHDGLALSSEGWAMLRSVYDGRSNPVDIATYGPDGSLKADGEGIARRRSLYDERNLVRGTTFFDASDRPTHDRKGVHAIRYAYDDAGRPTSTAYFDEHDRPVKTP